MKRLMVVISFTVLSYASNGSELVNFELVNSEAVNFEVVNSEVVNSEAVNSEVVNSKVVNSELVNSEVVNSEVVNSEAVNSEVVNSKVVNSKVVNPNNDADGHATQDLSIVPSSIASEPKTYGGDASSNTNVTNATISEVVPSPVFVVNTLTATKGVQYARLYADFFLAFFNILDDNMLHYGVQMNVEYNVLVKLFYNLFFRFCNKSTLEFGNNESTIVLCYCILQRYCLKVWKGTTVIYTDHGCLKVWKEPAVILSSYVYRSTRLALMLSTQYLVDYVYDMKSIAPSQDRKRFFEDEFEMLKVLDYNIFPCADKYEEIYKEIQILLTLPSEERKKKFIRA